MSLVRCHLHACTHIKGNLARYSYAYLILTLKLVVVDSHSEDIHQRLEVSVLHCHEEGKLPD